jgi:hypothetical protein
MDESKIVSAVQSCMREASDSGKPFRAINDYLSKLKSQG